MLGDSFTMGKGVEDEQTFSFGLQEILENELESGKMSNLGRVRKKVNRHQRCGFPWGIFDATPLATPE